MRCNLKSEVYANKGLVDPAVLWSLLVGVIPNQSGSAWCPVSQVLKISSGPHRVALSPTLVSGSKKCFM